MNPTLIDNMSWRMAEVYAEVVDRIIINLARHFKMIAAGKPVPGSWDYQLRKLAEMGQVTRETEAIILESLGGADEALQQLLEEAIRDGLKDADPILKKAAEQGLAQGGGFLPPEIDPKQTRAFQAYYKQSADKLNLVNTVMLDSTEKAYRETVADIAGRIERTQGILNTKTGEVISGTTAYNQAVRDGVRAMAENGLTGFIDHGGHHWTPEAYVAMDIRSTMANTARAAVWEDAETHGVDLYQVSHHDGARPLCYPWQGKVISKSGWRGTVQDDEGNPVYVYAEEDTSYGQPAGLFGVNCGHYPIPFIPGFSRIRPPEQNEEENAKAYEESQKQRELERKLRNEKRDLGVLKAQDAPEEEIRKQRQKVATARDNLDDFCTQTGRARQRSNEGTPIQANWNGADPGPFDYGTTGKGTTKARSIQGDDGTSPAVSDIGEKERLKTHNPNTVSLKALDAEGFTGKFDGITDKPEVDNAIRESAVEILRNSSGTTHEDLYLIDGNTGEVFYKHTASSTPRSVSYTDELRKRIDQARNEGRSIISVHNHPNGMPPSLDDGASAFHHGYDHGIVVGHNLEVWQYSPTNYEVGVHACEVFHNAMSQVLQFQFDFDEELWYNALSAYGMEVKRR